MPTVGEAVEVDGLRFEVIEVIEVIEVVERRIAAVLVTRLEPTTSDGE